MKKQGLSKSLTWAELAEEYDKLHSGRKATTLPMNQVFDWAESRPDLFVIDNKKGTIKKIKTT